MVAKYVRKLENGDMKNFYDVPNLWREQVKRQLEVDGYIINEDGSVKLKNPEG